MVLRCVPQATARPIGPQGPTIKAPEHLADRVPQRGLAPPPDKRARASYFRWMLFSVADLVLGSAPA
jgi:hypothetical protein